MQYRFNLPKSEQFRRNIYTRRTQRKTEVERHCPRLMIVFVSLRVDAAADDDSNDNDDDNGGGDGGGGDGDDGRR